VNYLLHNPTQLELIRQETAPAFQGDKLIDLNHLYENCPLLTDVWHETLRMYSHATSARAIKKDTVIGGKVLRKGHRIMIPYRILHFDAQVWGDEVNTFKPDRFAARTSELTKSSSWRPFGGGKSLCSGRYVARHLAFMFIAMLLRRFDVEKLGNPIFPEGDIGKPVLGMMSIKEEEDYLVEIKKRKADA
jgi:cytochrome P450